MEMSRTGGGTSGGAELEAHRTTTNGGYMVEVEFGFEE